MTKEIKIVTVGKYVGAIKSGKCPMYSITTVDNFNDWFASLHEDFPDYKFTHGQKQERADLAKFIVARQNIR